jgi:hypothetical protein
MTNRPIATVNDLDIYMISTETIFWAYAADKNGVTRFHSPSLTEVFKYAQGKGA